MDEDRVAMWCGPNDGGIKRGDRADTGDEARPTERADEGGSDIPEGEMTGRPTSDALAESTSEGSIDSADATQGGGNIDDLRITNADDPTLGLTNMPGRPAEDWAADTGPTQNPESVKNEIQAPPREPSRRKKVRAAKA